MFSGSEPKSVTDNSEPIILNEKLNPCSSSSNWISADVGLHTLTRAKYSLAMQYISNLLTEHPSWPEKVTPSSEIQYKTMLSTFENKLHLALAYFEQKYSLIRHHLINMVFTYYSLINCYDDILFIHLLTFMFLFCSDYCVFMQSRPHVHWFTYIATRTFCIAWKSIISVATNARFKGFRRFFIFILEVQHGVYDELLCHRTTFAYKTGY